VEIFRPGIFYGGMQAEALALNILIGHSRPST
jgi:hypothetical protein